MQVRDVFTFFFFLPLILCYYSFCLFFAFGKKRGTKHVTQSFDFSIAIAHEIVHTTTSTTSSPPAHAADRHGAGGGGGGRWGKLHLIFGKTKPAARHWTVETRRRGGH